MKKPTIAIIATLSASSAFGDDDVSALNIIPELSYQDKHLSFEQRYSGNATNNAKFDVHMPMLNAAITLAYKRFFLKAKVERSMADISTTTTETDRSVLLQSNLISLEGSEIDVERSDDSFTFGVNVWRSLSLFVGYLDGKTTLVPDAFCADPFSTTPCSRTNRAFQQYYLGDAGFVENQAEYKQTYSESGYYIGGSYSFQIKDYGALSLSIARADMDGEYRDNANDPTNAYAEPSSGAPTFVAFHYKGETLGTSMSIGWSGTLGDSAGYFVDIRRQKYSMKGEDVTGLPNFEGVKLNTDEEILGISAGVRLYF